MPVPQRLGVENYTEATVADLAGLESNTAMERGITREDVDAMKASAISDAAIANLYMRARLQNGRDFALPSKGN